MVLTVAAAASALAKPTAPSFSFSSSASASRASLSRRAGAVLVADLVFLLVLAPPAAAAAACLVETVRPALAVVFLTALGILERREGGGFLEGGDAVAWQNRQRWVYDGGGLPSFVDLQ